MKTRFLISLAVGLVLALSVGCSSLPNVVSVDELEYKRTDPVGGTTITAKGVKIEGNSATVEEWNRETHYPSFNQTVKLKGAKFDKKEDVTK